MGNNKERKVRGSRITN